MLTLETSNKSSRGATCEDLKVIKSSEFYELKSEVIKTSNRLKDLERHLMRQDTADFESSVFSSSITSALKTDRSSSLPWKPSGKLSPYRSPSPSPAKPTSSHQFASKSEMRQLAAHYKKLWQNDQNKFSEILDIFRALNGRLSHLESLVTGESVYTQSFDYSSDRQLVDFEQLNKSSSSPRTSTAPITRRIALHSDSYMYARENEYDIGESFRPFTAPLAPSPKESVKPDGMKGTEISPRVAKLQNLRFSDQEDTLKNDEQKGSDIEDKIRAEGKSIKSTLVVTDDASRLDNQDQDLVVIQEKVNSIDQPEIGNTQKVDDYKEQIIAEFRMKIKETEQLIKRVTSEKASKKSMINDWVTAFQEKHGKLPCADDKEAIRELFLDYKTVRC